MADVAIYGSGFAGYTMTAAALEQGQRVIVVERGPRANRQRSVDLARIRSPWELVQSGGRGGGEFGPDDRTPRLFCLGGTSLLWAGKWRRLDAVDFCRRSASRAWPITVRDLEPFYRAAADRFGLDIDDRADMAPVRTIVEASGLRLVRIALPQPVLRLDQAWANLETHPNLQVFTDVERLDFELSQGEVKRAFAKVGNDGECIEISASRHVITAGGIASPYLIHRLSGRKSETPKPFLGGYMDHPKGPIGRLMPTRHIDDLDYMLVSRDDIHVFALPEAELLESGIGNHSVFVWGETRRDQSLRSRICGRWLQLNINCEQFPDPANGISLDDPPEVRWRISSATRRDIDAFLDRILPRISALFGPVKRADWVAMTGASHPAGCTPLSASPLGAELHADGQLPTLANAFCVSSSGFPFAGSANPTLTVVALAERLAQTWCPG
ncbi:GMC oxidoreductase [Mesorhizobium sp.]|uniref:GMC oxidoreductase n=1 Tax=Mesorhizobium sp. TaxID=1871066 RepID=UPI000FE5719E|nr:GMC oxidoreductase [Mesorhizobium sp.]RWK62365.1 MAG: GMC family oxidoreductase [Mesorhizobium sp.]RWM49073.1 MAG: GMC family oxidoreductase [Mesorhizobium sp.]RWM54395.1 MAG: GMC family oxidoreductase [Mesorhizobium sp.]RWM61618.1 MAG: GMC family oxidoreductase [Mesorhizobium sp.]RWN03006.1 MAG: GMC family oxidoreductase [Mesorhizobium sp.]